MTARTLASAPADAVDRDTAARPAAPDTPADAPAALLAGQIAAASAARPLSVFDLLRIGIGPSSSHTVGPMRAGRAFAAELAEALAAGAAPRAGSVGTAGPGGRAASAGVGAEAGATGADQRTADAGRCAGPVARVRVELYGSLGATGRGHATDRAVVMGLAGYEPETVPAGICRGHMESVEAAGVLEVHGVGPVPFSPAADIRFLPGRVLPYHVNGMTLTAHRTDGGEALRRTFYSVGGGFVMEDVGEPGAPSIRALAAPDAARTRAARAPHTFSSSAELLEICEREGLSVSDVVMANEASARPREKVIAHLDRLREAMNACIEAGMAADGILPGGLGVRRRARALHQRLLAQSTGPAAALTMADPLRGMDWVNLFALAVNEENAAGRRVVTAPTNGAAGVVPAVLAYYERFIPGADDDGARRFLLAATAVGGLIKTNASIAGAEVGCQGEVGSASSMAAAGLAEALGGTPAQVENAAEIAMEHNLGLTCDPVGGLVQIPCIERNAVAAVKAINAARMALWGQGRHAVSLDTVIETMRQTGEDMLSKYKETSLGGLAVNVVEC
ncbi:serine ammonia-lyase [Actinomyces sp. oral taxon 414]|uniref:L-serine ammonia-lyase n=1 Tax=Actinomyces sp. oral taxon 414 TaxID=712122 RepID=UPI0006AE7B93|nr:L-serine ammonia-lyase [Actinomyces sp. oral taxon 414]ALD00209.1 serine ammonia-lyase [Actinomyces sp. oral taxon 414]